MEMLFKNLKGGFFLKDEKEINTSSDNLNEELNQNATEIDSVTVSVDEANDGVCVPLAGEDSDKAVCIRIVDKNAEQPKEEKPKAPKSKLKVRVKFGAHIVKGINKT